MSTLTALCLSSMPRACEKVSSALGLGSDFPNFLHLIQLAGHDIATTV